MGPIVCATRGGEAGLRTQERAIELAKERNAALIFLCVVDSSFAGPLGERQNRALNDELQRLGSSLLNIARARARTQGVEALVACGTGPAWESIGAYLREVGASTLVIGAPKSNRTLRAFGSGSVQEFAERLQRDAGVEVVLVE